MDAHKLARFDTKKLGNSVYSKLETTKQKHAEKSEKVSTEVEGLSYDTRKYI